MGGKVAVSLRAVCHGVYSTDAKHPCRRQTQEHYKCGSGLALGGPSPKSSIDE